MKKVSAAVVIKNQKVLLTRRSPNDNLAGYWEFPGGKVESNETPQHCLKRELEEELGINSTPGDILCESVYEYDHGEFKIIAILTDLASEDFDLKIHDKLEWVDIKDLLNYKLLQADIPIEYRNYIKYELTN